MSWNVVPVGEWPRWREAWLALSRASSHDHALLHPAFIDPLIEAFAGADTFLAVDTENGSAAHMLLLQRRGWGNWESFTPSQMPITSIVAAEAGRLASALESLWRALPGCNWLLGLQRWDERYQGAVGSLGPTFETVPYATTMSIDMNQSFAAYWQARPSKLRSNIGRYTRRLDKIEGGWSFRELNAPADIEAAVVEYGRLEGRGWKGAEGSAIGDDNEQGRFYRAVMRNFAALGRAHVFELRLGGQLIASRMGVDSGGMLVFLKTAYDEQHSEIAPGRILLHLTLERAFLMQGLTQAEFYTNASADQLQWCTESRAIGHVNCHRTTWIRKAHGLWQKRRRKDADQAQPAPAS